MSVFGVHKVCWRALHDGSFRAALEDDPSTALEAEGRLVAEERELLLAGAVDELHRRGANAYLLANLMRAGVLGLTKDLYIERMSSLRRSSDDSSSTTTTEGGSL